LLLPNGLPQKLPNVQDPEFPGRKSIEQKIPLVQQLYQQRASCETDMAGMHWICFQPVMTVLLVNDSGVLDKHSAFPRLRCRADHTGRHMVLLVCLNPGKNRIVRDLDSIEAYLIGGKFEISIALSRPEPIGAPAAYSIR
jgi:hypothetical protein